MNGANSNWLTTLPVAAFNAERRAHHPLHFIRRTNKRRDEILLDEWLGRVVVPQNLQ